MQSIYLAGGCFWCTEATFLSIEGIKEVVPGYMGGETDNPTYEQVCQGNTGHAEVVKCVYEKAKISLETILEIFFKSHNPTQLNRQGNDLGTQYRSAIFVDNDGDQKVVLSFITRIQKLFTDNIVTQVSLNNNFFEAEDMHKNYYFKNPTSAYCMAIIKPKLEYLSKNFSLKNFK